MRPPWSMVEHIGFDAEATNARTESWIKNPPLRNSPLIPVQWPEPVEHFGLDLIWQKAYGSRPSFMRSTLRQFRRISKDTLDRLKTYLKLNRQK
jgi:hypothetical protein